MRAFAGSRLLLALALFLLSFGLTIRAGTFTQDLFPIASTIDTGGSSVLLTPNAAFTAGNIVVCRVGDGSAGLGSFATPAFLDEYDAAGTRIQSVALPTASSGSNQILTVSGSAATECQITRSIDGRYILVTGYGTSVGISVPSGARVIGRVDANGIVNTSTSTTSFGNVIRSAASDNGTNIWAVGDSNGVIYTTFGSSGAGTVVSTTPGNNRVINVFDGQLYNSPQSSSIKLGRVGTGLPTTTGQTVTNLSGFPTSGQLNGFYFADLSSTVPGVDTLYISNEGSSATPQTSTSGGVKKFSLVSGSWSYSGTFPASTSPIAIPDAGFVGLTGSTSGSTVTIYATRGMGSQLVSFVDTTGYNAAPTASPSLVAVPGTNTAFRGVVLAPVLPPASPPNATNLSASETYTEDTSLNLTDIVVTDADSTSVTATLALSTTAAGSLSTATSGSTTSTFNAGTGLWSASGPIADVNILLAGVVFSPSLNFNSSFTIATSVTDGITSPVTGSKAITGIPVNDAPTATNLSAAEAYTEDTSLNLIDIAVSDVDSATVTATLALSNPSAGALSTDTSGPVTSTFNAATGIWTASGPIANVNTLLAGLIFTPAADFNGAFTIATSVSDDQAAAVTDSKAMSGTAANDAPTATNLSASDTYDEDIELNLTDIVVSDVDSPIVTVNLTLSNTAAGSLTVGTSGSVTSTFNSSNGMWTAAGPIADVNALLASVKYAPAANFDSNFSIATSVSDGIATPITGSKAMVGVPFNDAPILDAGKTPVFASVPQDSGPPSGGVGTLVSSLVDFATPAGQLDNVSDPDSGALLGIAVTDADTTNGSWFYSIDGGTAWLPLGSVSDASARLLAANSNSRLYFQPTAGFLGQASITFRAWDQTVAIDGSLQSATPNGGGTAFSSASDTAAVDVSAGVTSMQFSSATYSGPEGFAATVTVTRTGDVSGASSVDWSTSGSGGGSCDAVGVDYESASGTLTFAADEVTKTFTIQLCSDHESDNGESVSLDLENVQGSTLGTPFSSTLQILDAAAQFTNMQPLTIATGGTSSPYGTSIAVSGSTGISGVKLTLFGVNYANPDDLDVLLVGPNGETFVPVADVGGSSPLVNATVTLEDDAVIQLPDGSAISDGQNYKPAVCTVSGVVGTFATPAPGNPYNQAGCGSTSSTFASVFGNTSPNGTWTLYIRDDNGDPVKAGAVGGSIGGWGIQLLAPTAAEVTVSGRVRTPENMGIRGAVVSITGGHLGQPIMAVTNSFGYYQLKNVPAGASYVVTVQARRHGFAQPSRMLNVQDSIADADFVSVP